MSNPYLSDDADDSLLAVLHLIIQRAGHLLLHHGALRLCLGVHRKAAGQDQTGCCPQDVHVDVGGLHGRAAEATAHGNSQCPCKRQEL